VSSIASQTLPIEYMGTAASINAYPVKPMIWFNGDNVSHSPGGN